MDLGEKQSELLSSKAARARPNSPGGNMKMGYRADSLRAWTMASSAVSGGITAETEKVYQYYDGGNSVLEIGMGGILSTNVFAPDGLVARSYTPPELTAEGEGELDIEILIGSSYIGEYMFDWQGNATHILTPNIVQEIGQPTSFTLIHSAYNAWGQKRFLYPTDVNMELHRFGYNARWGYRTDTETGLVYCQNRYYDPANGRWVTRDPIAYAGGVNLYGYCQSGPVGWTDPTGLLTLAGDTGGWACFAWFSPGNWSSHSELTKFEAMIMMVNTDDDTLGLWGHGNSSGWLPNGSGDDIITAEDFRWIAAQRKLRGKKKFKKITINSCEVMKTKEMQDALLELGEEATGYAGECPTTPQITIRQPKKKARRGPGVTTGYGGANRPRDTFRQ